MLINEIMQAQEQQSKSALISFENNYPGVVTESNVNDILASLKAKRSSDCKQ